MKVLSTDTSHFDKNRQRGDGMTHDLTYTLRLFRRAPAFVLAAVATLSLGIGASTAMFTIIDSVLLRPLRFPDAERLVMLRPTSNARLSAGYLAEWRRQSRTFADMAGWHDVRATLTGRGEPVQVLADQATTNFFAVLGTPPLVGRTFTTDRDLSRIEPEVVLSYGLWQRRFGGDPNVVGQSIVLDGETQTIIGVMPQKFAIRTLELAESRAELWRPLRLEPKDLTGMGGNLHIVGRLAPRATLEQAQADLSAIAGRIEEQFPSYSKEWRVQTLPLLEATVRDVRPMLVVLFGAVALLLFVACANVATLAISRSVARQAEFTVRSALGASRSRLVRQLFVESLVIAGLGGLAGMVLAWWGTGIAQIAISPGMNLPRTAEIAVNVRALSFACVVTLLAAASIWLLSLSRTVLGSVSPARATRGEVGQRSHRLTNAALVAQVGFALMLLAGTGLLVRTLQELTRVAPGFDVDRVLTMRTTLSEGAYASDDRIRAFGANLLRALESESQVSRAGFANYLPMSRGGAANRFLIDGRAETRVEDQKFSWVSIVGGRYFEAMGIPLLSGRLPGREDTDTTEPVFVIDEGLARRYWPNVDPVGARLTWFHGNNDTLTGRVIGVVGRVKFIGLAADAPPSAYWWFPQVPTRDFVLAVRSTNDAASVASAVIGAIRQIDPNQPVADVRALAEFVADDMARPRFAMRLLGGFAVAALLLAGMGLYGVVAFWVARRTSEIALRVAIGAQRGDVLWLVMRRTILLVGSGVAIGLIASIASARMLAGLLYGVTPADPTALVLATLFLVLVSMVAAYLPARRALQVDAIEALRADSARI
jgi:putative ABC transport system permease protein